MLKSDGSDKPTTSLSARPGRPKRATARHLSVLGIRLANVSKAIAVQRLEQLMCAGDGRCHSVFFVNAHTLNVSVDEPDYRHVLNSADIVFNDGTGVRWAARQRGIEVHDNLNGTDLIPMFFDATNNKGYRFFLLGAACETIRRASNWARSRFAGWELAGHHHGYIHDGGSAAVIEMINAACADVLLVGMGNPLQERWIHRYQSQLRVSLAIGVGGLFDYWGGGLVRAPDLIRRLGCEWVHLLVKQPHKWRRYLLGNPKFLYRMTRDLKEDLAAMNHWSGR
jgi:N-acetylglucosaminyldiphosphoundecaprenol N-acetyl-beta-D-mannosaminyltransferase